MYYLRKFLPGLFLWFYRLDIPVILGLFLAATLVFRYLHRRWRKRMWWRTGLAVMAVLWVGMILFATVLSRSGNTTGVEQMVPFHSYRAVMAGGNPEILRSNFMNMVLFHPAGLLLGGVLPDRWPRWARAMTALVLFGCLSLGIEYLQYANALGQPEIDDILHNTFGAVLGSLCVSPAISKRSNLS